MAEALQVQEEIIGPQPGPQTDFLSTSANIAIFGGAAGGGKSYGLLLETLRHFQNPLFGAVIFRRNTTQIRNEGGLWDESLSIYTRMQGHPKEASLEWTFPSGSRVKFAHLEYENTVFEWQGSQIPFIGFDELTSFTEYQFWYMLSRNRSVSGVPGYIRATCNPDPDSWVRKFIDWWIGEDGFPIKERSGKLRWFVRINDRIVWADTKEALHEQFGNGTEIQPKSVTFIAAKLSDNKILMEKDPAYLSNLLALSRVDRMRLLEGNWDVRPAGGLLFRREWFRIITAVPGGWIDVCRFWDRAATKPNETNKDPDWTRGLKLYKYSDGTWVIGDLKSTRDTPGKVEELIKNVASHDGVSVKIRCQRDPGSAGVAEGESFVRMLVGYQVAVYPFSKNKVTRAKGVSAQCEAHNVLVLRAEWNDELFYELENFPDGSHDDIPDCLSGAFNEMSLGASTFDAMEQMKEVVYGR